MKWPFQNLENKINMKNIKAVHKTLNIQNKIKYFKKTLTKKIFTIQNTSYKQTSKGLMSIVLYDKFLTE